jgi:ubiquinone biosynthesis protein UbiJ
LIIEQVINRILQMDPDLIKIMSPLQHKVISIHCLQFPQITLYIRFDIDHLSILINRADLNVDTEISGELASFAKFLHKEQDVPLSSMGIKVYGDLATAQNLEIFLKKLDIDWQEHLAQITNDQFSEATAQILHKSIKTLKHQANSLTTMLGDYLNYETDFIANKMMLAEFYEAVDNLRDAVDRLASRMDHYANT